MSATTANNTIPEEYTEKHFYELANDHIKSLNKKFREKAVITKELQTKIIECLSNSESHSFDSHFRTWCHINFKLLNIGSQTFLSDLKTHKSVLLFENMYSVYKQVHIDTNHGGRDKCLDELSLHYSWYSRPLVQIFLKLCMPCQTRTTAKIPINSKPIIELGNYKVF